MNLIVFLVMLITIQSVRIWTVPEFARIGSELQVFVREAESFERLCVISDLGNESVLWDNSQGKDSFHATYRVKGHFQWLKFKLSSPSEEEEANCELLVFSSELYLYAEAMKFPWLEIHLASECECFVDSFVIFSNFKKQVITLEEPMKLNPFEDKRIQVEVDPEFFLSVDNERQITLQACWKGELLLNSIQIECGLWENKAIESELWENKKNVEAVSRKTIDRVSRENSQIKQISSQSSNIQAERDQNDISTDEMKSKEQNMGIYSLRKMRSKENSSQISKSNSLSGKNSRPATENSKINQPVNIPSKPIESPSKESLSRESNSKTSLSRKPPSKESQSRKTPLREPSISEDSASKEHSLSTPFPSRKTLSKEPPSNQSPSNNSPSSNHVPFTSKEPPSNNHTLLTSNHSLSKATFSSLSHLSSQSRQNSLTPKPPIIEPFNRSKDHISLSSSNIPAQSATQSRELLQNSSSMSPQSEFTPQKQALPPMKLANLMIYPFQTVEINLETCPTSPLTNVSLIIVSEKSKKTLNLITWPKLSSQFIFAWTVPCTWNNDGDCSVILRSPDFEDSILKIKIGFSGLCPGDEDHASFSWIFHSPQETPREASKRKSNSSLETTPKKPIKIHLKRKPKHSSSDEFIIVSGAMGKFNFSLSIVGISILMLMGL